VPADLVVRFDASDHARRWCSLKANGGHITDADNGRDACVDCLPVHAVRLPQQSRLGRFTLRMTSDNSICSAIILALLGGLFGTPVSADASADRITFIYAGALRVAPTQGVLAQRLSSPPGEERFPRFSPHGQHIAFTGNYDGSLDVYVAPAMGGATMDRGAAEDVAVRDGPPVSDDADPAPSAAAPQNHRSRMLDLGGRRTEIVEWGSGDSHIVLIHGANISPHMFDTFAPRFSSRYHVVAYARRGHGKATPPSGPFDIDDLAADLRIVMDSLGIQRAVLMGHSFGGNEITRFAAVHPDRVASLVYLDAHFDMGRNPYYEQAMESVVTPDCVATMKTGSDLKKCAADYLYPPIEWTRADEELIADMVVDTAGAPVYRTAADHVVPSLTQVNTSYAREYDRIKAPALFLMSDTYLSVVTADTAWNRRFTEWHETSGYIQARQWWMDQIRAAMPSARITILDGTSHDMIVSFDSTYDEVNRFLAGLSR
jgi:pimeloyl-ACP methyl ester carboxylesterase